MRDLMNDTLLPDCQLGDQMWGYAVRMAMEMSDKLVQQSDRVLHRLFNIGIYDWSGFDTQGPEGIWSMWHSALIGHRLQVLLGIEQNKVHQFS